MTHSNPQPLPHLSRQVDAASACLVATAVGRLLVDLTYEYPVTRLTVIAPPEQPPIVVGGGMHDAAPTPEDFAALRGEHPGAVLAFSNALGVVTVEHSVWLMRSLVVVSPDGYFRTGIVGFDADEPADDQLALGQAEGRSPDTVAAAYGEAAMWVAENAEPSAKFLAAALRGRATGNHPQVP
jgi:hypothetical protein